MRDPLPIDAHLDRIVADVRRASALVIVAAPGAGKTTRVPPALAADGPVIVLQPRRVAARTIARRIADEQRWTLGDEVGWHVRFERRFSPSTRVLLATEGILTARLQQDPLASDFRTIVLDEFHERSIHADLGLALARQAQLARDDLRLVVMSATLDPAPISAFLGGCPVVEIAGEPYPLTVDYAPGESVAEAARTLAAGSGRVLCFLPGAGEIRRAQDDLARLAPQLTTAPLYGALSADEQDRALAAGASAPRVILATNIAETSLTVPGVHAVVDSGLQKVARYDPSRGIDSLETERISSASAGQRAGRAARLGPGRVRRLWSAHDRLRPHSEPDIARIDLAAPLLDVIAWGGSVRGGESDFAWFEPPPEPARVAALRLLERLGALDAGRLTPLGRQIQRMPAHPRLARLLIEAGGAFEAAAVCAALAERGVLPPRHEATTCDLLAVIDQWERAPGHIRQAARALEEAARRALGSAARSHVDERELRRAIFAGFPDRLAQRREPNGDRVRLASGAGATLAAECGVRDGEWLAALDVQAVTAPGRAPVPDARVRMASRVEPEWIAPTGEELAHDIDASGRVRAVRRVRYDALALAEHPAQVDPSARARLLAQAWRDRGPSDADRVLLARLRFAGLPIDPASLVEIASLTARSLDELDLAAALDHQQRRDLERLSPESLTVPSGRRARLDYPETGGAVMAVKLQELFGLAETPRIGPRHEPVLIQLLAPNGRPVQTTRDLRSFWTTTYPEVRKELRGRYPKHPWPDDPWTATPTARTKKSMGRRP